MLSEYKSIYPPPYLSFYTAPYLEDLEDAKDYIRETIDDQGPFDGIIGFSQGCALAASMMLEDSPMSEIFRFGVFFCASLPFNKDDLGGKERWDLARKSQNDPMGEFAGELELSYCPTYPEGLEAVIHGRFHPARTPETFFSVPVLHVIGKQDPFAKQSRLLSEMSEQNGSMVFEHGTGHEMPRNVGEKARIVEMISELIDRVTVPAA